MFVLSYGYYSLFFFTSRDLKGECVKKTLNVHFKVTSFEMSHVIKKDKGVSE